MSNPQSDSFLSGFSLDASQLAKSAISTVRVTLGVSGVVALIVGILITFWPKNSAVALTIIVGIYFVIAGIAYLGLGIFSRGISGGARALDIVLGILFIIAGIVVFSNPAGSTIVLGIAIGVFVGILWIIEGVVALVQSGDAASRGWAIFFGLISIVAGLILVFSPAYVAALWWILGISLIVLGLVQIVRAFTFGRGVSTTTV